MPQLSACVLALDTFSHDIIPNAERDSLRHILENPEKAGRENKKKELTVAENISIDKILNRQV